MCGLFQLNLETIFFCAAKIIEDKDGATIQSRDAKNIC